MKHVIISSALLLCLSAFAEETSGDKKFETTKERLVKKIGDRILLYSKLRDCLDKALTKTDLKRCGDKYASDAKRLEVSLKSDSKKIQK